MCIQNDKRGWGGQCRTGDKSATITQSTFCKVSKEKIEIDTITLDTGCNYDIYYS